jgi:protoheme IX farnesyltransferase
MITIIPFAAGLNSWVYLAGALVLDMGIIFCAAQFLLERSRPSARRLFFASILFLPILLGVMVFTKL